MPVGPNVTALGNRDRGSLLEVETEHLCGDDYRDVGPTDLGQVGLDEQAKLVAAGLTL